MRGMIFAAQGPEAAVRAQQAIEVGDHRLGAGAGCEGEGHAIKCAVKIPSGGDFFIGHPKNTKSAGIR